MNQKANTFLETERIGKLMAKYAVPCVISLLVAALYNIVDQIFIANADYLGSYGNARQYGGLPIDCGGLVYRSDDWRRPLCLCQHQPGRETRIPPTRASAARYCCVSYPAFF